MPRKPRKTWDDVMLELINEELKLYGLTVDDIRNDEDWYIKYTMTEEQSEKFSLFAIKKIMKDLRFSKKLAEHHFSWFWLAYGLKTGSIYDQRRYKLMKLNER